MSRSTRLWKLALWSTRFAVAVGLGGAAAFAHAGQPVKVDHIDLRAELGRQPSRNTLKLFRAAVDTQARRLYVSGILTPSVAVLDLDSERWVAFLDSGVEERAYRYLFMDDVNHLLWVRDGSRGSLTRVDPETGAVGPQVAVPARAGSMLCDGARSLVYLLTPEEPSFRAFREDTLETAWTSDAMGTGISSMVQDPETGELLILDGAQRGPGGLVYRLDPDTQSVTGTIELNLPAGARGGKLALDSEGHRLVVTIGSREVWTLAMNGTQLSAYEVPSDLELEAVAVDGARSRLLMVATDRPGGDQAAGVGGHLLVAGLGTLSPGRDIAFGRKLHSLVVDPATGLAYLPNGDASVVWKVDPGTGEVTGLRLGDSAEQVVPVNGGRTLVMNSRLGGSYLMAWDAETGHLETFEAGVWPIPLRSVPGDDLLLVLNAWDGTVSVYLGAELGEPLAIVPLDLPAGTTDRLPDLAVDPERRLAFAAYPEHAAVAVVDLTTFSAAGVLNVPGARAGDIGGGPGQLLVGVDSTLGRLLAVEPSRGRVTVFSIDSRDVVATADFSTEEMGPVTADMMFVDEEAHTCWVGRLEIATATGSPTGRTLPRGDRVFAVDSRRGLYWVGGVETTADGPADVLAAVRRDGLAEVGAWTLGPADTVQSSVAYVPPARIYVTRMAADDLAVYAIAEPVRRVSGRLR